MNLPTPHLIEGTSFVKMCTSKKKGSCRPFAHAHKLLKLSVPQK